MKTLKTTDAEFVSQVETWITRHGEVLMLFRYPNAAGSKDFEFAHQIDDFKTALQTVRPLTWVIIFGQSPLPLCGEVDDVLIDQALQLIPDGREFLIICLEKTVHDFPHFHYEEYEFSEGETHEELREALEEFRGRRVRMGVYPPWVGESEFTLDAVVPDEDGEVRSAAY